MTTLGIRWVRLDARRCLRIRAVPEPTGAVVVELQVHPDHLEPGDLPSPTFVIPAARVRELGRSLMSLAGEVGLRA